MFSHHYPKGTLERKHIKEEYSKVQNRALGSLQAITLNVQDIHIPLNSLLLSFPTSEISKETPYTFILFKANKHAKNQHETLRINTINYCILVIYIIKYF